MNKIKDIVDGLPHQIKRNIEDLNALIEKYPQKIPVGTVAKFLGMDVECLKRCVEQGAAPFAIGCNNGLYGNKYTYISTTTFYLWYLSPIMR